MELFDSFERKKPDLGEIKLSTKICPKCSCVCKGTDKLCLNFIEDFFTGIKIQCLFSFVKIKVEKKVQEQKRENRVSGENIPMFKNAEERLKYFPNKPKSLKEIKNERSRNI